MAKRFNFSLQKVLEIRQHMENVQAVRVFKTKEILKSEEQKLNHFRNEKHKAMREQKEAKALDQKINLNELKIAGQYISQLSQNIEEQDKKVAKSDEAVKIEINKLNEALKDKKVVQKLRERHFEEHKKMLNQQYDKQQDEVAIRIVKDSRKDYS